MLFKVHNLYILIHFIGNGYREVSKLKYLFKVCNLVVSREVEKNQNIYAFEAKQFVLPSNYRYEI